ncbi:MAG: holo-ACP synthase [Rhodoferax sp.]
MIFGIGTDLCDVRRIQAALDRHGPRFAQRILTPTELRVWQLRSQRWPQRGVRYLATRFSAKEAISKALGLGLRQPMSWQACEIGHTPSGQPQVLWHGALAEWAGERDLVAHISLSDEGDYALSFCVIETGARSGPPQFGAGLSPASPPALG